MAQRERTSGLFLPITAGQYVCTTWFERDRANIRLETPNGREVFDLWDDDVAQAVEDGYLTRPRVPRPTDADWQPHAVRYAIDMGLIPAA
ncbi:hypothetical protein Bpfe_031075 [Biomphalaria pfeifferi]|uniref:Uncharacterized protein n=1 Tax=Biomphalaria pfeifferi TaxID=112525 RepID=A0AAD8APM3_BIOPF|nr:hypothetical protein Bpfe_031075 [Biomphalaria pfeifferi]